MNHTLISFVVSFNCPGMVLREKKNWIRFANYFCCNRDLVETQHFPFIVTAAAVSCLTDVLYLQVALKISICMDMFYGKALAQVLATIQIFQSQNMLNCTALLVHLSPEVKTPLVFVYSFCTYIAQQELGLYLSSWGLAFYKDLVPTWLTFLNSLLNQGLPTQSTTHKMTFQK